jgi:hypothetical protein
MADQKPDDVQNGKGRKLRSPAYPAVSLETAIERARTFHSHERRNPASFVVAVGHWGFKEKSSGGLTTVAALKSFGLMKDLEVKAGGRTVQLTDLGLRILLDNRDPSPERDTAIKQAALSPKIHVALWKKWGTQLPSDNELRHRLIFDWKFNENSVADFVQEYKDTIAFAKLTDSDTISGAPEDKMENEEEPDMPELQQSNQARQNPLPPSVPPSGIPKVKDPTALLTQALVVSIPRNFRVDINVRGDELRYEDLAKIKSQFNRWIEGLEEAFKD